MYNRYGEHISLPLTNITSRTHTHMCARQLCCTSLDIRTHILACVLAWVCELTYAHTCVLQPDMCV